ncbi:hypothetical protein EVB55_089 [Rhizobium phage RHph_Y68]|uniref:Uncharacterized protein n=1 Tax=Rhizobium phage RHph_Y68 TaxID=2509787 RepID=A0A7S5R9J1_9CAUD|nr:hypothetical protein PP934_gp089 [Rhizobium phage RHph_Y68]QIG68024.1 hypothetical protein EVB55_089 [Rhizobium phage RHph_Y68]
MFWIQLPGVHYTTGINDKILAFLKSKIRYADDFEVKFVSHSEISNRQHFTVFLHPEDWPNRLYRMDIVYRDSVFRDPTEFFATLQEVTQL